MTAPRDRERSAGAFVLVLCALCGCAPRAARAPGPASFVGAPACAACHPAEARAWQGSHHERAMQAAGDSTVLGDFREATFTQGPVTSRFFRRAGRFAVRTDGPDGRLADYEIRYTFGVAPLQQYLVELPGGRLQALPIAWDARPRSEGGQRWFHLHPGERVTHDDELHWTRPAQNWNRQCAVCHSTNLHKNYDPGSRTYRTTWSDLSVGCEACHGPGSRHVAWAGRSAARGPGRTRGTRDPGGAIAMGLLVPLEERRGIGWARDASTDLPRRSRPRTTEVEIETCARCHSSRTRMFDDDSPGTPLMDAHLPALLTPGQYYADGQVDGEVYEYGSFLQSRMYHEGVTCSDCHEPHRATLRAEGNALCLQCHDGARYDAPAHHHHATGTPASRCMTCHMPARTFMQVHVRHDHGFRVPRPDVADSAGAPVVCASCHAGKPSRWALERIREWNGREPGSFQRFGGALTAGRRGDPVAPSRLIELIADRGQPAIARGTALAALGEWRDSAAFSAIRGAMSDPDPRVRLGAVTALTDAPRDGNRESLLLAEVDREPMRVLRALAGGALAGMPVDRVPAGSRAHLEHAKADYIAAETENSDQPFARVNLGNFHLAEGDASRAEQEFRAALDIDPDWIPATVNLADLLRTTGRDAEGATVLEDGLARHPESAVLHHSLGLLLVRQHRYREALDHLRRAAILAPDEARFTYVYAVALSEAGRSRDALAVVTRALTRRPGDGELTELRVRLESPGTTVRQGR